MLKGGGGGGPPAGKGTTGGGGHQPPAEAETRGVHQNKRGPTGKKILSTFF